MLMSSTNAVVVDYQRDRSSDVQLSDLGVENERIHEERKVVHTTFLNQVFRNGLKFLNRLKSS